MCWGVVVGWCASEGVVTGTGRASTLAIHSWRGLAWRTGARMGRWRGRIGSSAGQCSQQRSSGLWAVAGYFMARAPSETVGAQTFRLPTSPRLPPSELLTVSPRLLVPLHAL